ncbi:hypothetical protein KUTeg_009364 [Tegillarca granosa]|uniref:Uncharacterized protein n=1 Tax=Tegillarca granosa TaxID=220873 RepID=A0ABQ9F3M7_TEGGR|nr:hypothetical protein KUTeg_009364 [Tegillarca granosa]
MCVCVYFDVVVVVVVVNNDCCVVVELLLHQLLMLIIFLFTEENILCAISDLLFAHIGNIGVVLSWAVVYMIRYPEIQRKCREEIKQVTPITVPHLATKDGKLRGYHIPKGTILVGDLMAAYITNIENGEKFKPERFMEENGELMKTKYNLNFGIGKNTFIWHMAAFLHMMKLV